MAVRLTEHAVDTLFARCAGNVRVDCLGRRSRLAPRTVEAVKPQIEALLSQLLPKFHQGGGAAREARLDRDGFEWDTTPRLIRVGQLFAMATACGLATELDLLAREYERMGARELLPGPAGDIYWLSVGPAKMNAPDPTRHRSFWPTGNSDRDEALRRIRHACANHNPERSCVIA